MLKDIQDGAASVGINFEGQWGNTGHDRSIIADTGGKLLLGRGLGSFQKGSGSQFDIRARRQGFRRTHTVGPNMRKPRQHNLGHRSLGAVRDPRYIAAAASTNACAAPHL